MGLPGGVAASLVAAMPSFVIVMQWVIPYFGGVRPTLAVVGGLVLGSLGVLLVFAPWTNSSVPIFPSVVCLLACLCWGFGTLMAKKETMPPNALLSTGLQALVGSYFMQIIVCLRNEYEEIYWDKANGEVIFGYAYMVLIGSSVGYTVFSWLTRTNFPIPYLVTYSYVNPLVALLLDFVFLGNLPAPLALVGCLCIVVSVFVTTYFKYRKAAPPSAAAPPLQVPPPSVTVAVMSSTGNGTDSFTTTSPALPVAIEEVQLTSAGIVSTEPKVELNSRETTKLDNNKNNKKLLPDSFTRSDSEEMRQKGFGRQPTLRWA